MAHTLAGALLLLCMSSTPSVPQASAPHPKRATPSAGQPAPRSPPLEKPKEEEPQDKRPPPPERSDRDTPGGHPENLRLKVIRQNMPQVENCFDRAHSKSSSTQGEVRVEWDITSWGDVNKAQVTSNTTGDPELADCILQAVKSWRFEERGVTAPSHMSHVFRLVGAR